MRNDARRSIGNEGEEMTRIRDADDPQALALDMEPEQKYYAITGEEIDWLCCTSIDTGVYEPGTPEFELACKVRMKTKADIFSRPLAKAKPGDCPDCPILTGDDAKRFTEYIRSPDHTPEGLALIRQAHDLAKVPVTDNTISSLISENARIGAELRRMTERADMLSGEHDAKIAHAATLAENKRVLDKLSEKIYCEFHAYQIPIDRRQIIDDCRKIIESLRTQEPPK